MRFLTVSKARGELPTLVDSIERVVLTRNGEPVAILLHLDDYRALRAMRRMAGQPDRLAAALSAHERVQRGDLDGFPELHDLHGEMSEIAEPAGSYGDDAVPSENAEPKTFVTWSELRRAAAELGERLPQLDQARREDSVQELISTLQQQVLERRGRRRRTAVKK